MSKKIKSPKAFWEFIEFTLKMPMPFRAPKKAK